MQAHGMKVIEKDGLPTVGTTVLAVCSGFRCLGRVNPEGFLVDAFKGDKLPNVVGYFDFDAASPKKLKC